MYHYKESGLDNVYLQNGYEKTIEDGEEFISFVDAHGLHNSIARRLTHQCAPLSGKEFRFLRVEMDMSQKSLADCINVSEQTVARWEKGSSTIPKTSDVILRGLYLESINHESNVGALLSLIAEHEGAMAKMEMQLGAQDHHWKVAA